MKIRDLSVVKKIWGSYFIVFSIFSIVGALIVVNLSRLNDNISTITNKSLVSVSLLKEIQVDITMVRKDEFSLLPNSKHPQINKWLNDLERWRSDVQANIRSYEALPLSAEEQSSFQVFKNSWNQYINETQSYNSLLSQGKPEQANDIVLSSFGTYSKALESLDNTLAINDASVNQITLLTQEEADSMLYSTGLGALFIVLTIILSSLFLSRIICRPINRALDFASNIARGQLNNHISEDELTKDELGTLLTELVTMQTNLNLLVSEVNDSTIQLTTAVEEVSAISSQTASGMQTQQMELSSVASAMTQMQAAVNEVAQNTKTGVTSANSASERAKMGNVTLKETIDIISNVSKQIEASDQLAQELEVSSNNINMVVDVIRGIADQTNLLALNAAIEAARAGEQGRGFAVVADEVRSLAQRTQSSTTQIIEIVSQLQENTQKIGQSSRECQTGISLCVNQVNGTGEQISEIEHTVDNIADMSTHIATACSQQYSVSEELNKSIEYISTTSSEITEGASQTATACQDISRLTHNLKDRLGQFQL